MGLNGTACTRRYRLLHWSHRNRDLFLVCLARRSSRFWWLEFSSAGNFATGTSDWIVFLNLFNPLLSNIRGLRKWVHCRCKHHRGIKEMGLLP